MLQIDADDLEQRLEKVKSSQQPQILISELPQEKAERFQQIFNKLGLKTSLQQEWTLEPVIKEDSIEKFQCPSCDLEQESNGEEMQVCSSCGIVKEKYLEAQKRKQEHKKDLEQIKALEQNKKVKTLPNGMKAKIMNLNLNQRKNLTMS
ncbi:MAG: hypothetical protein KAH22_06280 [Thiotrichaceae bacterium]|nr:hypothetical protein [Thiotrichaceae bacterium]